MMRSKEAHTPLHSIKTNILQNQSPAFALALCISHLLLYNKSLQNLSS